MALLCRQPLLTFGARLASHLAACGVDHPIRTSLGLRAPKQVSSGLDGKGGFDMLLGGRGGFSIIRTLSVPHMSCIIQVNTPTLKNAVNSETDSVLESYGGDLIKQLCASASARRIPLAIMHHASVAEKVRTLMEKLVQSVDGGSMLNYQLVTSPEAALDWIAMSLPASKASLGSKMSSRSQKMYTSSTSIFARALSLFSSRSKHMSSSPTPRAELQH
ncbi:uncharacterized protein MONBRDRAFT_25915 [Monosiga brevicollis MX1]|uniref:Uncharacterized protein n=1 Tax=Monosiga brevicollis TaxID=81824 RepID=A9V0U6_MONBE|nr:uncharacterized protein MONBRDRAFT_25915 [Monosiga brevicollis MX1]EDQ88815.1 predicted protein [Monosiga brevicollis MX1]|eukprot:XP_001746428.1 hypothetical protein [Monosiga brevicollis MX1]